MTTMTDDEQLQYRFLYKLVDQQTDKFIPALTRKVIRELQRLNVTTSGDDSSLKNCWDEICVQQQDECFWAWDVYEQTIERVIEGVFEQLPEFEQKCINFSVLTQHPDYVESYDGIYTEEVVSFILQRVLSEANNYTNPQIRAYLNSRFEFD